jgi:hypothetical protein
MSVCEGRRWAGWCADCARDAAAALSSNPILGSDSTSIDDSRILLEFAESDFALRFKGRGADRQCQMTVSAAVRAPSPSLDTWWSEWDVPVPRHAAGPLAVQEVVNSRARFRRMVEDRSGVVDRFG